MAAPPPTPARPYAHRMIGMDRRANPVPESLPMRINIGCGMSPTVGDGWANYDNSLIVRLAELGLPESLVARLMPGRLDYYKVCRRARVRYADALHVPLPAGSVDFLYSSHMLEHLDE